MAVSTRRILHCDIADINRDDESVEDTFSHAFIDGSEHYARRPSLVQNNPFATAVLDRLNDQGSQMIACVYVAFSPSSWSAFSSSSYLSGSILSRFLLATDEQRDDDRDDKPSSCWSRLKCCFARPGSMDSMDACWCSLMLEPMESRSTRIIMLGEAYALFGKCYRLCVSLLHTALTPRIIETIQGPCS